MSNVTELNDETFNKNVADKELAFVDVYASWCGSCRLFFKTFEEVASENTDTAFFKIEGEENEQFRDSIEIPNLPFVAAFSKGKFIDGISTTKKEGLVSFMNAVKEKIK